MDDLVKLEVHEKYRQKNMFLYGFIMKSSGMVASGKISI